MSSFCTTPLFQGVYSIYVLLVLLIVSIASPSAQAVYILGYLGVAVVAALIVVKAMFKYYILPYYDSKVKSLQIDGWTSYAAVYNK